MEWMTKLDPTTFFGGYSWDDVISRNHGSPTHPSIVEYENELKKLLAHLATNTNIQYVKTYQSVISKLGRIDRLKLDFDFFGTHLLDLLVVLKRKNMFPSLIFHFDRFSCERLAESLFHQLRMNQLSLFDDDQNSPDEKRRRRNAVYSCISDIRENRRHDPHYKNKLDKNEQTFLLDILKSGIGVHHGQLDKSYRVTVERMFRKKLLRVVFATGTLSYGINMPARSACLLGDSPFLNPTLFNQTTGRSGRRGYDTIGKVVLCSISAERIRRLMVSENDRILGNVTITPSYVTRLFIALSTPDSTSKKNVLQTVRRLMNYPLSSLHVMHDKRALEVSRKSMVHHLRFSVEFLLANRYLQQSTGHPINLSGLASHLFYTNPANFLFLDFLKKSCFDEMIENYRAKMMVIRQRVFERYEEERDVRMRLEKQNEQYRKKNSLRIGMESKTSEDFNFERGIKNHISLKSQYHNLQESLKKRIMHVLCYIFTGIECRREKRGEVKVTVDKVERNFQTQIGRFSKSVIHVFLRYLRALKTPTKRTYELPFSKLRFLSESDPDLFTDREALFVRKIREVGLDMGVCNLFAGASGNSRDTFKDLSVESVIKILDDSAVFFDPSLFPIPYAFLGNHLKISSLVFDFYNRRSIEELSKMHHLSAHVIVYHLNMFRKKLQKISVSMTKLEEWFAFQTSSGGSGEIRENNKILMKFFKLLLDDYNGMYFGNSWKQRKQRRKELQIKRWRKKTKYKERFESAGDLGSIKDNTVRQGVLEYAFQNKSKKWRRNDD